MARCIKCNYALVLLPHRAKYKCSKCGKLFNQRHIDNIEFRKWNRLQKEIDRETLLRKPKLTEEQRKHRSKEYYVNNKDKIISVHKQWKRKNRLKVILYKKIYRIKNRKRINAIEKLRRQKNIEYIRSKARERWHNKKQIYNQNRLKKKRLKKALALMFNGNCKEKASPKEILNQKPTFYFFNYCFNEPK